VAPALVPSPAIALVRECRQVKQTARELGIHEATLHSWLRQECYRPQLPAATKQSRICRSPRRHVRQLERKIVILRRATTWLDEEGKEAPKGAPDDRRSRRRRDPCLSKGHRTATIPPAPCGHHRRMLAIESGNQAVGQVKLSPDRAAVPAFRTTRILSCRPTMRPAGTISSAPATRPPVPAI